MNQVMDTMTAKVACLILVCHNGWSFSDHPPTGGVNCYPLGGDLPHVPRSDLLQGF